MDSELNDIVSPSQSSPSLSTSSGQKNSTSESNPAVVSSYIVNYR